MKLAKVTEEALCKNCKPNREINVLFSRGCRSYFAQGAAGKQKRQNIYL